MREIADALPLLAWIADGSGRITWRNRRWAEYTGWPIDELNRGGWREVRDPAELARVVPIWQASVETGQPFEDITRIRGGDGVVRPFLCRAMPVRTSDGAIECWFGTNTEISELQNKETRLEQLATTLAASEARFRAAVEAVEGVVWTNDATGRMMGEQTGWTALTGQTRAECEGFGWADAVHPEDAEATVEAWNAAVAERRMFVFEHRVRRRDGAWRRFAIRAVPVFEPDGAIREWVGVHTDITEQRAAEEALRVANAEIQRTTAIVSHDLRSPLLNMHGFMAELNDALDAVRRQQARIAAEAPALLLPEAVTALEHDIPEAIGFVRGAAHRMDRLVSGILRVSREGQRTLSPEPVDLAELVASLASGIAPQLAAAGARFETAGLKLLHADRLALEQVIANLVDNAIKYLDPARPGQIRVSARQIDGEIMIDVADNGRGIAEDEQARAFDLFRRVGEQNVPGEGIGLAHVLVLVRRMGGHIAVRSQPGVGSTFTVTLPVTSRDDA